MHRSYGLSWEAGETLTPKIEFPVPAKITDEVIVENRSFCMHGVCRTAMTSCSVPCSPPVFFLSFKVDLSLCGLLHIPPRKGRSARRTRFSRQLGAAYLSSSSRQRSNPSGFQVHCSCNTYRSTRHPPAQGQLGVFIPVSFSSPFRFPPRMRRFSSPFHLHPRFVSTPFRFRAAVLIPAPSPFRVRPRFVFIPDHPRFVHPRFVRSDPAFRVHPRFVLSPFRFHPRAIPRYRSLAC